MDDYGPDQLDLDRVAELLKSLGPYVSLISLVVKGIVQQWQRQTAPALPPITGTGSGTVSPTGSATAIVTGGATVRASASIIRAELPPPGVWRGLVPARTWERFGKVRQARNLT